MSGQFARGDQRFKRTAFRLFFHIDFDLRLALHVLGGKLAHGVDHGSAHDRNADGALFGAGGGCGISRLGCGLRGCARLGCGGG